MSAIYMPSNLVALSGRITYKTFSPRRSHWAKLKIGFQPGKSRKKGVICRAVSPNVI